MPSSKPLWRESYRVHRNEDRKGTVPSRGLDPYTAVCELFGNNFQFCVESSKGHYKVTSEDEFKKFVKDYDNKHGSQWSKPATYGNVIATVNMANMDVDWV